MTSSTPARNDPVELLLKARAGDADALGALLGSYRNYLSYLARMEMGRDLEARIEASDLVQETLLDAHRDFAQLRATEEKQVLAWLRRLLAHNLVDQVRRARVGACDPTQQRSLEDALEASSLALGQVLATSGPGPATQAATREQAVLLANALAELSQDQREVILLRHVDRLPFEEIGARLGRSSGAVRMLWVRGLEKLREQFSD